MATYCVRWSGQRDPGDHLEQVAVGAVVDVRDLRLHHHGVLLVQRGAQREGSRQGDAGLYLVHVLVLALHPRRALHAGIPVRAVGIHDGGRTEGGWG